MGFIFYFHDLGLDVVTSFVIFLTSSTKRDHGKAKLKTERRLIVYIFFLERILSYMT